MSVAPSIYVGSYRRYNEGSLHGAWLNLEDYDDLDGFWAAARELHAEEIKAYGEFEPMFQDWEGIPSDFIGESHIDKDIYEKWVDLDEDDREMFRLYLDGVNGQGTLEQAQDAFQGKFRSEEDWAEQYMSDCMDIPKHLEFYIDYEKYARDCRVSGDVAFVQHEGETWVFNNY